MKRVLVVSFDFPPRRTSATYRVTGLTKYVLRLGWQPTVLTVQKWKGHPEDPSLLERVPSQVRVVRTRVVEVAGWENPAAAVIRKVGSLRTQADDPRQTRMDRRLRSLGDWLRAYLYLPDQTVGWVPFGLAKAIQLHREQPYDVVYTTNPPRSNALIGWLLKILLGIPWVLEFMDPWYPTKYRLRARLDRWLQGCLLRRADSVIVMTQGHKEDLEKNYPLPVEKVAVISNGYDEDDFNCDSGQDADLFAPGYLHLSHFGTVYPDFHGDFFRVLAELVHERPAVKEQIRVHIVGYPDAKVREYAKRDELRDVIQIHGFVPHKVALQAMRSSHCLLLFLANPETSRLAVSGKIYEYLRVGRPILAVAHEGGLKELVEASRAGWVVRPDDVQALKRALGALVNGTCPAGLQQPASPEFVAQFRWERLAGQLAGVFDRVSNRDR